MSSDLIALVVALALGTAVVILGLRRNLSETTRNGLPQFERVPEQATATLGPPESRGRRSPPSSRQRHWLVAVYLLLALSQAASAVRSSDDWLIQAIVACLSALCAVAFWLKIWPPSVGGHRPDSI
jgi:hypothetical protein